MSFRMPRYAANALGLLVCIRSGPKAVMPACITDVRRTVATVLGIESKPGSLLVRDTYTLILTDCACIPQASLALITEQFPALEVAVHASEHSSSGYVVIFTMQPTTSVLLSAHGLQVAALGFISLLVFTSPFFACWRILYDASHGMPTEA